MLAPLIDVVSSRGNPVSKLKTRKTSSTLNLFLSFPATTFHLTWPRKDLFLVASFSSRSSRVLQPTGCLEYPTTAAGERDRKSTRLNSSHPVISHAVFSLYTKIETS